MGLLIGPQVHFYTFISISPVICRAPTTHKAPCAKCCCRPINELSDPQPLVGKEEEAQLLITRTPRPASVSVAEACLLICAASCPRLLLEPLVSAILFCFFFFTLRSIYPLPEHYLIDLCTACMTDVCYLHLDREVSLLFSSLLYPKSGTNKASINLSLNG